MTSGPVGDPAQVAGGLVVAAVQVGIHQSGDRLVVDIVRRIRLGRVIEIAVRRDALRPFGQERIDLLAAGRIARGGIQPRQSGNDLAEDVERVGSVPAAKITPRGTPSCAGESP